MKAETITPLRDHNEIGEAQLLRSVTPQSGAFCTGALLAVLVSLGYRIHDGRADPDIQGFYWTLVPRDVKWGEPEFGPVRAEFHEVLAEVMLDIAKAAAEGWRHEQALLAIQDLCVPVLDTRVAADPVEAVSDVNGIVSAALAPEAVSHAG